jgi:hypothetical protein
LITNRQNQPDLYPIRLAVASVVTVVAARLGKHRLLTVAVVLALPVTHGPPPLTIFAALPRMTDDGQLRAFASSTSARIRLGIRSNREAPVGAAEAL